jgi:hypothetical protein
MSDINKKARATFVTAVQLAVTNLGTRPARRLNEDNLVISGNSVATVKEVHFVSDDQPGRRCEVTLSFSLGACHLMDQVQTVDQDFEYHVFGVNAVWEA